MNTQFIFIQRNTHNNIFTQTYFVTRAEKKKKMVKKITFLITYSYTLNQGNAANQNPCRHLRSQMRKKCSKKSHLPFRETNLIKYV